MIKYIFFILFFALSTKGLTQFLTEANYSDNQPLFYKENLNFFESKVNLNLENNQYKVTSNCSVLTIVLRNELENTSFDFEFLSSLDSKILYQQKYSTQNEFFPFTITLPIEPFKQYSINLSNILSNNKDFKLQMITENCIELIEPLVNSEFKLKNSIDIFPNPTKNELTVLFKEIVQNCEIIVLNEFGITLNRYEKHNDSNYLMLDFGNYISGIYFVKVTDIDSKDSFIKKIVVSH